MIKRNYIKFFYLTKIIAQLIVYTLLISLIILPIWLNKKFGDVYFDQFILNAQLAWHGYLGGDHVLVSSFYKWMLLIPFLLSILLIFIKFLIYDISSNRQILTNTIKIIFIRAIGYLIHFKVFKILLYLFQKKIEILILILLIIISFYFNSLIFQSIKINSKNDFIDQNYIKVNFFNPSLFNKNLIVLYVESFENTYGNENLFGENLLLNLMTEDQSERSIKKYIQVTGYGYTLASLVATQCGIPLKPLSILSSSNTEFFNKFLPNADCLTDILKKSGYYNIFITSDDLVRSGFKNYTSSHNFDEAYGLDELYKLGIKTSKSAWHDKNKFYGGVHDDDLLKFTLNKIKEIDKKKNKYFFTIFTLDTHAPSGYFNPKCNIKIKTYDIKDVVVCTTLAIEKFIKEFKNLNLQNTNLVVLGDHLFMNGADGFNNDEYFNTSERYVFNKFISVDKFTFNRDYMNFFDLFPSLIEFTGQKIKDGRLGLGLSVFNDLNKEKNIFSENDFLIKLEGDSKLYNELWIKK